jgi:uncharacterized membrane protein YdbT with pleckstrin-like domain
MGYVDEHLLPGEQVQYRAHIHKIVFIWPILLSVIVLLVSISLFGAAMPELGGLLLLLAAVPLVWAYIAFHSSEFAVTDRRVIIKVGWIRRRTLETMLGKVEGIGVDQTVLGRLLGFGTITVTGTGGTKEPFANIADPLEFRRQVQAQVAGVDDYRRVPAAPAATPIAGSAAPRDERDCPYCAERILKRARVCKHCGRDVEPVA